MAVVQWKESFSVSVQELDEQHKCIVKFINELYDALAQANNRHLVAEVTYKLVQYTQVHFAVEEALMRIFHYEGYEGHKASHDKLVQEVLEYQKKFLSGDDRTGIEMLIFLKEWLFKHIEMEDKQYVQQFHQAGVKKSWLKKFW